MPDWKSLLGWGVMASGVLVGGIAIKRGLPSQTIKRLQRQLDAIDQKRRAGELTEQQATQLAAPLITTKATLERKQAQAEASDGGLSKLLDKLTGPTPATTGGAQAVQVQQTPEGKEVQYDIEAAGQPAKGAVIYKDGQAYIRTPIYDEQGNLKYVDLPAKTYATPSEVNGVKLPDVLTMVRDITTADPQGTSDFLKKAGVGGTARYTTIVGRHAHNVLSQNADYNTMYVNYDEAADQLEKIGDPRWLDFRKKALAAKMAMLRQDIATRKESADVRQQRVAVTPNPSGPGAIPVQDTNITKDDRYMIQVAQQQIAQKQAELQKLAEEWKSLGGGDTDAVLASASVEEAKAARQAAEKTYWSTWSSQAKQHFAALKRDQELTKQANQLYTGITGGKRVLPGLIELIKMQKTGGIDAYRNLWDIGRGASLGKTGVKGDGRVFQVWADVARYLESPIKRKDVEAVFAAYPEIKTMFNQLTDYAKTIPASKRWWGLQGIVGAREILAKYGIPEEGGYFPRLKKDWDALKERFIARRGQSGWDRLWEDIANQAAQQGDTRIAQKVRQLRDGQITIGELWQWVERTYPPQKQETIATLLELAARKLEMPGAPEALPKGAEGLTIRELVEKGETLGLTQQQVREELVARWIKGELSDSELQAALNRVGAEIITSPPIETKPSAEELTRRWIEGRISDVEYQQQMEQYGYYSPSAGGGRQTTPSTPPRIDYGLRDEGSPPSPDEDIQTSLEEYRGGEISREEMTRRVREWIEGG